MTNSIERRWIMRNLVLAAMFELSKDEGTRLGEQNLVEYFCDYHRDDVTLEHPHELLETMQWMADKGLAQRVDSDIEQYTLTEDALDLVELDVTIHSYIAAKLGITIPPKG